MSRQAFSPTQAQRELASILAAAGFRETDIASALHVDPKTLRKHLRVELDEGHGHVNARVVMTLYRQALSGNTAALIWWTKARMGWSSRKEISGPDGEPLSVGMVEVIFREPDPE